MAAQYWYDLSKTVGASLATLVYYDGTIQKIRIQNNSPTATIAVAFAGGAAALNSLGSYTLGPGAILSEEDMEPGNVTVISSEAGAPVTCRVTSGRTINPNVWGGFKNLLGLYAAPPGDAYAAAIKTLYFALQGGGLLDLTAGFWLPAGPDAESARLNWITGAPLTLYNAPTFTRGQGWNFTAASLQYANTEFIPSSDSRITANTHSLLVWTDSVNTVVGSNNPAASSGDLEVNPKRTAGTYGTKASFSTSDTPTRAVYGGMHGLSRSVSTGYTAYEGSTATALATASDGALSAYELLIGARPSDAAGTPTANTYYTGTVKAVLVGGAMTPAQVAAANAAVAAYLTAVAGL
jgi:hypothetical protein